MHMDFGGRQEKLQRRVRLCFLVLTLDNHVLGSLIHLARLVEMRAAPPKVDWMLSLLRRPGFLEEINQVKETEDGGRKIAGLPKQKSP